MKSWSRIVSPQVPLQQVVSPKIPVPTDVKHQTTTSYPQRDWSKLDDIKHCKFSLPFKDGGKRGDYGKWDKIKNNDILLALYYEKSKWVPKKKVYVYTGIDFSVRYVFDIISFDGKTLIADQSFLHYNGKNWMPCSTREVIVVLY